MVISAATLGRPPAAMMPSSARCARKAFTDCVLCCTRRARVFSTIASACCSAVLMGTKRMVLRPRLADGFRIGRVRLTALDERFDVGWWNEAHIMAEVRDLARPIVSTTACLHANQTWRQFFEEAQHFAATQFPIEQGRACNIGTVNLENVFGQIEPDGANILHGTVPPLWRSSNDHVLALDAVGAGRSTSSHPVGSRSRPLSRIRDGRASKERHHSLRRR